MIKKILFTIGIFLAFSINASAQEHLIKQLEVKALPNGEVPAIVINPVDINDKVKSIETLPFVNGKTKVIMKLESSTSRLNNISLKKSGVVEVISSNNI